MVSGSTTFINFEFHLIRIIGSRDSITYGSGYVEGIIIRDYARVIPSGTAETSVYMSRQIQFKF
jgi:hypothetical protein